MARRSSIAALALALAVCGGSKGTTMQPTPTPPAPTATTGTVVDVLAATPIGGVQINVDGVGLVTSSADGSFSLMATQPQSLRQATLTSDTTVQRTTHLNLPGPAATVSLIASAFDLTSFDQMFRGDNGELHRWTNAPTLVVQKRVLQFTNTTDTSFTALAASLTDDETDGMIADLSWALPQLTGSTFSAFASQQQETAAEGASVLVSRPGTIVIARYEGLKSLHGSDGYSRWAWNGAGAVQSGIMMLDRQYDAGAPPGRRALRAHELGHALGYNHVTSRVSVMNATVVTEPNDFDRNGARLAFARPPLNRTPDVDPSFYTTNSQGGSILIWRGAR